MNTLVAFVRSHALANYEVDGWDYVVECYSDADIADVIGDDTLTSVEAISRVGAIVGTQNDQREDAVAAGGNDPEDYDDSMDGDFDSAMASAGFGTDEDYGYFGGDD